MPSLEQIEASETGGRNPTGIAGKLLAAIAIVWCLLQVWVASPIPFSLGIGVLNDTEVRSLHLGFAILLAYLSFPPVRGRIEKHIPVWDIALAIIASGCALYIYVFYTELAERAGAPTDLDIGVALLGIVMLLEATRRALGWPLTIIAGVFIAYTLAGPWLPEMLAHKGASLSRLASHQWLTTEGVFGVAVGVSASFVFLFVLFGSLLEQAGGGHYFIRVAFALVGHLRGGPAKAGILASGMTGMVSGSSIANVVTTGTFTIPLMKKVGFPGHKAGAIEVAASTNGQIMPPVMGAAAFLMMEYLNLDYISVIKHAFMPAVLSYLALIYVVHLEAVKTGMPAGASPSGRLSMRLLGWVATISGLIIIINIADWVFSAVGMVAGDLAVWINGLLVVALYFGLLVFQSRRPDSDAEELDPTQSTTASSALLSGLHFLLPIAVLVWLLMGLRLSPATSIFWAIVSLAFLALTQRPILAWLRGQAIKPGLQRGFNDLVQAMISGARNMIGIGVATATAGIVVGTVSLTGIGQVLGELIETLSMGSIVLMLVLTAVVCMILGMGLPTTANYIVVSTLMAPVVVQLAANNGLEIPLVAVHLFVFYFGILADDTPPVGLAAYAASGISGADPIKTGLQSFAYDIRTAILPFMFVFNTQLIMIGVEGPLDVAWVFLTGLGGMLLFVSATQGWLLTANRRWESALILLIAFTLFRPDYWRDQFFPAQSVQPAVDVAELEKAMDEDGRLRLNVETEDDDGKIVTRTLLFDKPADSAPGKLLNSLGLMVTPAEDRLKIDDIDFLSPAEDAGLKPGYALAILSYERPLEQPPSAPFIFPALLLLAFIVWSQRQRLKQ